MYGKYQSDVARYNCLRCKCSEKKQVNSCGARPAFFLPSESPLLVFLPPLCIFHMPLTWWTNKQAGKTDGYLLPFPPSPSHNNNTYGYPKSTFINKVVQASLATSTSYHRISFRLPSPQSFPSFQPTRYLSNHQPSLSSLRTLHSCHTSKRRKRK